MLCAFFIFFTFQIKYLLVFMNMPLMYAKLRQRNCTEALIRAEAHCFRNEFCKCELLTLICRRHLYRIGWNRFLFLLATAELKSSWASIWLILSQPRHHDKSVCYHETFCIKFLCLLTHNICCTLDSLVLLIIFPVAIGVILRWQ